MGDPISRPSVPLVILLPTLNEEAGLASTLRDIPMSDLRNGGFAPTLLVVDGHSTDNSVEVAHAAGATVITQQGKGKGAAVREGMDWAVARGVPYLVVVDADFTYPGSALPAMATLLQAGSDLVIGIRRPDRHAMSELRGLVHRLGNAALNFLAGYLSRGPILDVCSGLWGIRTTVLPDLELVSEGFDIEAEAFVKSFRRGLAISQVPVAYRDRIGIAKLHAFADGSRILLSILRYSARAGTPSSELPAGRTHPSDVLPPATVRDLQSVLFALNSHRVFVSAASGSNGVVDELVRRLSGMNPGLAVAKTRAAPVSWSKTESPSVRSTPSQPSDAQPWTIVIDLPSEPLHREGATATIQVPNGLRTIHVDLISGYETDRAIQDGASRSRAYKLERSSQRPLSSLRILSSSLAQFGEQRDLALIAANVGQSDYSVFRERGRKESAVSGTPSIVSGPMDGSR